MKKIFPRLFLFALLPMFIACDHINEDEQLIEVETAIPGPEAAPDEKPTATARTVLLEDFTGQRCVNCPKGTKIIEQLQETYEDRFIAVGIYWEPKPITNGLANELGNEYYNHWELNYQPVGLINRGGAVNYTDWAKEVREGLGFLSEIKMELEATLKGDNIEIIVKEESYANYSGKLQVWVIEDGIIATQLMPDAPDENPEWTGGAKADYVHNHVLRAAVNGPWGEDFSIAMDEQKTQTMTQAVDAKWNTDNLSVVAFVYNDDGVEQAVKSKVEKK